MWNLDRWVQGFRALRTIWQQEKRRENQRTGKIPPLKLERDENAASEARLRLHDSLAEDTDPLTAWDQVLQALGWEPQIARKAQDVPETGIDSDIDSDLDSDTDGDDEQADMQEIAEYLKSPAHCKAVKVTRARERRRGLYKASYRIVDSVYHPQASRDEADHSSAETDTVPADIKDIFPPSRRLNNRTPGERQLKSSIKLQAALNDPEAPPYVIEGTSIDFHNGPAAYLLSKGARARRDAILDISRKLQSGSSKDEFPFLLEAPKPKRTTADRKSSRIASVQGWLAAAQDMTLTSMSADNDPNSPMNKSEANKIKKEKGADRDPYIPESVVVDVEDTLECDDTVLPEARKQRLESVRREASQREAFRSPPGIQQKNAMSQNRSLYKNRLRSRQARGTKKVKVVDDLQLKSPKATEYNRIGVEQLVRDQFGRTMMSTGIPESMASADDYYLENARRHRSSAAIEHVRRAAPKIPNTRMMDASELPKENVPTSQQADLSEENVRQVGGSSASKQHSKSVGSDLASSMLTEIMADDGEELGRVKREVKAEHREWKILRQIATANAMNNAPGIGPMGKRPRFCRVPKASVFAVPITSPVTVFAFTEKRNAEQRQC